jgi:simple sugar transport system permease protein
MVISREMDGAAAWDKEIEMATTSSTDGAAKQPTADERMFQQNYLKRFLRRPELGALGGAVAVWVFFAITAGERGFLTLRGTANYLEVSAELGILSIAVSLLMIGGEFDLSVGSMIGATGMVTSILTVEAGWNVLPALGVSLIMAMVIGALNGILVIRTRLPSFIITLGTLFIIRGATIGVTRLITGVTQVRGIKDASSYNIAAAVFASDIPIGNAKFAISIVWWLVLAAVATWILRMTKPGNWIYGVGGDSNAARNVGVPVNRLKIILFMTTAAASWFVASVQVLSVGSADVLRGEQKEFFAIIAVVIGGTLLTGGYGSAIGAVLGALIFGMVQQGIFFTGVDSDWFLVFLGVMLILAVLVNNYIRKLASEAK